MQKYLFILKIPTFIQQMKFGTGTENFLTHFYSIQFELLSEATATDPHKSPPN